MARRPDPEYIRALKGKKPRIPPNEQVSFPVVPTPLSIVPPEYLTKSGQHHWERMALILATAGLLQEVGRDKLARYCQACADYEEIMMERKKLGAKKLHLNPVNKDRLRFWLGSMEHHSKEMKDFESEYGLTPASAARVRRPGTGDKPKTPQEKFDDYLNEIPKA